MLTAILVDDELASRETLANYLEKYCPEVQLLAEADSVKTGIEAIKKYNPNIVFLDVEMPYGNAFDLLEQVEKIDFETVFVTAYSNYAIDALNLSASYYILKPIDIDELVAAVQKIKLSKEKQNQSFHSKILIENIKAANKQLQKVVLPLIDGFEVVQVNEIVRCQAADNFTTFYLKDGTKRMICRTLKFYEDLLREMDFLRIHKSHLVNIQHIKKYLKGKGGQVILIDDSVVDVSANRKKELLSKF